jgi:molybdopterin converting factor small subunit
VHQKTSYETGLNKLTKIGKELKQACQLDTAQVDAQIDEIGDAFAELELKLKAKLDLFNDHLEKEKTFTASMNDVKVELETKLAMGDETLLPHPNELDKRAELRQKLDLCKQLVDNESSILGDENKTKTLQELKTLFDKLENLIETKQEEQAMKQNAEFENFKKGTHLLFFCCRCQLYRNYISKVKFENYEKYSKIIFKKEKDMKFKNRKKKRFK